MKREIESDGGDQDEETCKKSRLAEHEGNGEGDQEGLTPNGIINLSYEEKLKYVSVIAKPMASKKLTKKLLKLIKKAAKKRALVAGLKNVHKQIRRGDKGITIIAGDVTPLDVISHLPVLCEENEVPFAFIPLRYDISAAMGVKRPCVMVMVKKDEKFADLYDECLTLVKSLPLPSQTSEEVS